MHAILFLVEKEEFLFSLGLVILHDGGLISFTNEC
jgi:hypothetical protein